MFHRSPLTLAALALAAATTAHAQGPLEPTRAPAPSMKSLAEIWDRVGQLESTVQTLQTTVSTQRTVIDSQSQLIRTQSSFLADLANASGLGWSHTTMDTSAAQANLALRKGVSMVIDADQVPWIAHTDSKQVLVTRFTSSGGVTELASSTGTLEIPKIALASNGSPAVAYRIRSGFDLRLFSYNNSIWVENSFEFPSNPPLFFEFAIANDGRQAIAYVETPIGATTGELKIFWRDDTVWRRETIDPNIEHVRLTGLALAFNPISGSPAVAYPSNTGGQANFASRGPSGWSTSTVTATTATLPANWRASTALAFNPFTGDPTIAYSVSGFVGVSTGDGTSWSPTTLSQRAGSPVSIDFSPSGTPGVIYFAGGYLNFAHGGPGGWSSERFAGPGFSSDPLSFNSPALRFNAAGTPIVAYITTSDDGRSLNVAHRFTPIR